MNTIDTLTGNMQVLHLYNSDIVPYNSDVVSPKISKMLEIDTLIDNCKIYPTMDECEKHIEKCIYLGVPNIYCEQHFDDEDFIYNKLVLPEAITSYFTNPNSTFNEGASPLITQSFPEYVFNYIVKHKICIDFSTIDDNIYQKTIYIYQYVLEFYSICNTIGDKRNYIQDDLFKWVSNLISCVKFAININPMSPENAKMNSWCKELLYGIIVTGCHLKTIIKHHNTHNLKATEMTTEYMNKFFHILSNLCVILIYFKFIYGGAD